MRTPRRLANAVAALAAGSLIVAPVTQAQAQAQAQGQVETPTQAQPAANPSDGGAAGPDQSAPAADLPSRVGRLARISGTVSFHTADQDHWDPATLNYPVTAGDAFWTEPQAAASVEIAASRIDLGATTEFDVDQLDDHTLTATQAQGETFLQLSDLLANETYTVRTPRGVVTIATAGQYEIAAGDTQTPTTITVIYGAAQISGDNVALSVQGGQTATITGSGAAGDGFAGTVAPTTARDAFLTAEIAACTPASPQGNAVPPVPVQPAQASATVVAAAPAAVRQMPGGADLSDYGDWHASPQYGQVWYPRVAQDWVPYRDGHWGYVAPWGWTWIDDEAWGYAPFHYGRWIEVENRWGWAPTYYAAGYVVPALYAPVYAPALVGFFGFGAGLAAGLAIGGGVGFGFGLGFGGFGWGHIGWCPLGWNEPYRPWFRAGGGYFDRVNRFNVANIRNLTYINNSVHNVTINNYANAARGATVVPTSAMLDSRRAASVAQPFSRRDFADAHPVGTTPRPTAHTAGVTARDAERLGLPQGDRAGDAHSAPGPHLDAGPAHGAVPLRAAAAATGARNPADGRPATAAATHAAPGAAPGAAAGGASSRGGLPPLRTAGAVPRASGGAPGPAFTPHAAGAADRGPAATTAAAREAGRGAPGPSFAASRPTGFAGARAGLPALRTAGAPGAPPAHGPAASGGGPVRPQQYAGPRVQTPQTRAQAPHYEAPRASAPAYHSPAYQAPASHSPYQSPAYHSPYQSPAYHAPSYPGQPRAQTPNYAAQRFQSPAYHAPSFQAQAPHYEAPHFAAPAQHFAAPSRPAPSGRRPWPP